ncbi:MAG TPA: class II fructose-bisphosphate aldolase, partial [Candidatus Omnitrophota bacterium]|nr:class II fructose-bisphosphate aldolase [Candidatus Omnitrophota bacterium]
SHGYDFTENDTLRPYEGGGITVEEYSAAAKKGVVLARAKEIAKRFKDELGLDIGVALHGFSGTPLEVAPSFIGTGIAKVNINTDWQAITWKVLQAYFPELYRRCYDLSHEAAEKALAKIKEQLANAKDDKEIAKLRKSVEKLQALVDLPFERSRNKIIFGKDGAPGLRTLFRGEAGWALEEEIVEALKRTDVRMIIPDEQNKEDILQVVLTCQRCEPNNMQGLTALEAVHKLTKDRTMALMTGLELGDSAEQTPPTDKSRELRLQSWQVEELAPSGRDRFTNALQVPKDHHPDLKEVLPGQSGSYRYGGDTYSVGRLLVPTNPDRVFTPEELFETGTYMAEGQKRVIVESDDMMTYMSAD